MSSSNLPHRVLAYIDELLSPPQFLQDEQGRQARQLKLLIAICLALAIVYSVLLILLAPDQLSRFRSMPIWFAATVPPILLLRFKRPHAAIVSFLITSWLTITAVTLLTGGPGASTYGMYAVVVALAALWLGWQAAISWMLLSTGTGVVMVYLDSINAIPHLFATATAALLTETITIILLTTTAYMLVRQSERALVNARQELAERRSAEQALRESEKRYRTISEIISDYAYSYEVAPDGRLAAGWMTSDSFTRMTGYQWEEIGSSFILYHPDDADLVRQHVTATIQGNATSGEYRILTKSGELRWVHIKRQVECEAGRVIRYYGTVTDITKRKMADQALRESEAKFRSFFEIAPSGITIVDSVGHYVDVNPAFLQTLNLPRDAVLGRTADELGLMLGTPVYRQRVQEKFQATQRLDSEEVAVIYPDGRVGVALYSARATDLGGEPHFLTITMDITDRKNAESEILALNAELQQRATYLRTLHDIARAVTAVTDMDSTLRNIMTQLAGIVPFDMFYVGLCDQETSIIRFPIMYDGGRYWDQPDTVFSRSAMISDVLLTGQPSLVNRNADELAAFVNSASLVGDTTQVSASLIVVPLPLGERVIGVMSIQSYTLSAYQQKHVDLLMGVAYSVSIAIDNARLYDSLQHELAQRKQLEDELKRYTAQLEERVQERTAQLMSTKAQVEIILNSTSDAIALARSNGDILTRNPAFVTMFGAQVSNCIEHLLWVMPDDSHGLSAGSALLDVLWDRAPQRIEVQITDENGGTKDIDLALIPVQLADPGERPGILVSAHDITHLKEIERFKARFIADAVHDLATPITGLTTRLYLLKRTPEKLDDHVRAIGNQVDHLRNLLSDLRTLSLIDRKRLMLERDVCDLNQVALRVFDTYEPVALSKNQTLRLMTDPAMPPMMLDNGQIERVLVNLVSNAINYTPSGKDILIQTACAETGVVLVVEDNGMGIGEDELPHVFDRFYRSDNARIVQAGGTGLGLAIAKEIVELHGGSVTVESMIGVGSTFIVQLPTYNV